MEQDKTCASPAEFSSELTSQELDNIKLAKPQYVKGLARFILCTALAVFVFFVSLTINGKSQIVFGFIYNFFKDILGNAGYWVLCAIIGANFILHLYAKYMDRGKKHPKLADFYAGDNFVYTFLYALGFLYVTVYAVYATVPGFTGFEAIVSDSTGGSVMGPIVLGVLWIILVGAVFMPFLLNYGIIEFIGALLEPFMRPLFKLPGKAALDATASFISSSSLAVLITSRLYKRGVYTQRECVAVATCFSAVSIGFAYLVIDTAGLSHNFMPIYLISFFVAFLISAIVIRIPPICRKKDVFYDGHEQTKEERMSDAKLDGRIFARGIDRSIKRAYTAKSVPEEIKLSLLDSAKVIPQVLTMLSAIGVSALILAEYTPVFNWLGLIFLPLLNLLGVPDAAAIAPSMPVGIAEMFLPVLLISDKLDVLSEASRFMVVVVSMVQIIFFSETATVMLATKIPVKLHELVICFVERTILAILFAAAFMHILY